MADGSNLCGHLDGGLYSRARTDHSEKNVWGVDPLVRAILGILPLQLLASGIARTIGIPFSADPVTVPLPSFSCQIARTWDSLCSESFEGVTSLWRSEFVENALESA